jgi:hypothetical protein
MNYNGHCEGCLSHIYFLEKGEVIYCTLKEYNDEGQCPCSRCIVKMICEHACNDYHAFRNDTIDRRREGTKL